MLPLEDEEEAERGDTTENNVGYTICSVQVRNTLVTVSCAFFRVNVVISYNHFSIGKPMSNLRFLAAGPCRGTVSHGR